MSLMPYYRRKSPAHSDPFMSMLNGFFNDSPLPAGGLLGDTFKLDVREGEKEYVVEADLPGVDKDEIALDLSDGRLTISVSRTEQKEDRADGYVHRERRCSSARRAVYLADADEDKVSASLKDGVLKIEVQKAEGKPGKRKIDIH